MRHRLGRLRVVAAVMLVDHKVRLQHQVAEATYSRDIHSVSHRRHIDQLFRRRRAAWRVCTMAAMPRPLLVQSTDPCVRAYIQVASARFILLRAAKGRRLSAFCLLAEAC